MGNTHLPETISLILNMDIIRLLVQFTDGSRRNLADPQNFLHAALVAVVTLNDGGSK